MSNKSLIRTLRDEALNRAEASQHQSSSEVKEEMLREAATRFIVAKGLERL